MADMEAVQAALARAKAKAKPKPPIGLGDPFAAFLAVRRDEKGEPDMDRTLCSWKRKEAPVPYPDPDIDPFATFLARRPPKESQFQPDNAVVQGLREDLLRTKRQLLQVGLKAELRLLDASCPPETAERLRRVRRAQRYLKHPERTLEVLSGAASDASDSELAEQLAELSPAQGSKERARGAARGSTSPRATALTASMSLPNLRGHDGGTTGPLPPIPLDVHASLVPPRPKAEDKKPLCRGWYSRVRGFNVAVTKDGKTARRLHSAEPGGAVAMGDGRLPLFTGSHLLSSGYFYAFDVAELDDANFPAGGTKELSIGFGVSRLPPDHTSCEHTMYAYDLPGAVIVGYGDHLIDGGKWMHTGWNPRDLRDGDTVGVLISPEGDFVVFVNGAQVLRVRTSLEAERNLKKPLSGQNRTLYPIVDLHGRVSAVTILTNRCQPNRPLQARNKLR